MKLVRCTHDRHASAILDIFNDTILNSTALFDYRPRVPESMDAWFQNKGVGRTLMVELIAAARESGFKFGRWLDLSFYQLILQTPAQPSDG